MKLHRKTGLYLMAGLYMLAGINHFVTPDFYQKIMPPWLPWHFELIYISGAAEIALGLLLLFPQTRRAAAWGIIALLIAVFPANIQMMVNYYQEQNPNLWVAVLRLPLQLLLIWWAYKVARKRSRQTISS